MNKQKPPFNRGDIVMDDNGEIGVIFQDLIYAVWDKDGNLTDWQATMRYRWDMESYGKTRAVGKGEAELYEEVLA